LVSEVFNVVLEPGEARWGGTDEKNALTILEWKIRNFPVVCTFQNPPAPSAMAIDDSQSQVLFQLALLVYLERASGGSFVQSETMRSRLDAAFTIFSQLKTLHRQFPLLILGCEARSDEHRMVVLDLISRTEESTHVRSLQNLKGIIQSLWAQDDLAERDLGYTDKITAVLSSSTILPSFA
jgi:Fungal specific transcription factor domain